MVLRAGVWLAVRVEGPAQGPSWPRALYLSIAHRAGPGTQAGLWPPRLESLFCRCVLTAQFARGVLGGFRKEWE